MITTSEGSVERRLERDSDRAPVRDVATQAFGAHGEVVGDLVDSLQESTMTGTLVYAEPFWRHDYVGLRPPGSG